MYEFVYERIETTTYYYFKKLTISVMAQTGCAPTEGRGSGNLWGNQPTNQQPAFLNAYIQLFILLTLCPHLKPLCTFIIMRVVGSYWY